MWKLLGLVILLCGCGKTAGTAVNSQKPLQAPTHDVGESKRCPLDRKEPALMLEHELCAENAGLVGRAQRKYFSEEVWPYAYRLQWSRIPSDARARLTQVLGAEPPSDAYVVIVARDGTTWLTDADRYHTGEQEAGGGPTWIDGAIRLCLVGGQDGHYETTLPEAMSLHWPEASAEFLALASRDADVFEWDNAAAHAQTENHPPGSVQPGNIEASKASFATQVHEYATRAASYCAQNDAKRSAYQVAYLLHAVQDLATHAGQTNAEHSYRAMVGENPDAQGTRVARAHRWTKGTLEAVVRNLLQPCLASIYALDGQAETSTLAAEMFGPKDGTVAALAAYQALGSKYIVSMSKGQVAPNTFWFNPDDEAAADSFLNGFVLPLIGP